MSVRHWLALSLTENIGPILARRLIEAAGGAQAACLANVKLLHQVEGIGSAKAAAIAASLRVSADNAFAEWDRAQVAGARIICPEDDEYSVLLRTLPDAPLVLYIKGDLQPRDLNSVAIVGSRKCSYYGREQAERFAALLGGAGVTVVSGGARGIDSAAHRGAMSHAQGRTLAVLGCSVNVVYPPENAALFEEIAARGAVISEYPIDTPPLAENFPRRNRIVSGLSRGVLVIEADERSGALITARQAGVDHGRPVFALPGRVDNKLSSGPHQLIRDGATLVTGLADILEDLGPLPMEAIEPASPTAIEGEVLLPASNPNPLPATLSEPQGVILQHLDRDPITIDTIIDRTGMDASRVLRELTFLTLKGLVQRMEGQTFRRT